jgi:hypothetical protein
MDRLLIITLVNFGLCYVVGHAKITLKLRMKLFSKVEWLVDLLECPACLGFWLGLFEAWLLCPQLRDFFLFLFPHTGTSTVGSIFSFALYTCSVNYILGRLSGLIRD